MAIYHLSSKLIGKSQGRTAVASSAYRSATKLYSKSADIVFDYTKRRGVAFSEILLPDHAPSSFQDRETLWNSVESLEKRKDAQYCREIEVALPKELTLDQNKQLLRDFIQDRFVSRGMIADYSIHDIDSQNPHCHILLTLRHVTKKGFGQKAREWNSRELFATWREEWANLTNKYLALNNHEITIDHRSYAEQNIDLVPTIHIGIQRKDRATQERFQKQQSIKKLNAERIIENPLVALEALSRYQAVFTHQDIALLAHKYSNTPEEFETLRNVIQYHSHMVPLGIGADNREYFTTQQIIDSENEFLTIADELSQGANHIVMEKDVAFVCHGKTLNEGQQKAFKHILEGNNLSLMVGFAGTGKSYLMNVLREAYEAKGYRVMGAALSGKVADSLQKDTNISSHTIARYLIDWENGRRKLDYNSVLIIDEAGMVGTRQFLALAREVKNARAKMILIGDAEQLQPIEAGNPFRYLTERYKKVTLDEILRQKVDWQKEATIELSTQKTALALSRYHHAGFVHAYKDRQEAMHQLMLRWSEDIQKHPNESQLILTYSNKDVLDLNSLARQWLKDTGRLIEGNKNVKVMTSRFGELEFIPNDRVMFLQNDSGLKVRNGALGTVIDVGKTYLTVQMDDGREIGFDTTMYNHLTHGYAATIHKSQGTTVDRSYVLATQRFDRFLANVAMDRHRHELNVFYGKNDFPDYQALSDKLRQGNPKIMATEFAQARGMEYPFNQDTETRYKTSSFEKQTFPDQALQVNELSQTTLELISEYYQQKVAFEEAMDQKMCYLGEDIQKTDYYDRLALQARKLCDNLAVTIAKQADIKAFYNQLTPEQHLALLMPGQAELENLRQKINTGNVDKQSFLGIAKYFQNKADAIHNERQLSQSRDEGWSY